MKSEPGTYALIFRSRSTAKTQVGRWGKLELEPGYYVYVGSAFGPGGVRARVSRHCRRTKPKRWHIDYLRMYLRPIEAWYSHEPNHFEHEWAGLLSATRGLSSIKAFGCSDCHCYSHFFSSTTAPNFALFSNTVDSKIESWSYRRASSQHQ